MAAILYWPHCESNSCNSFHVWCPIFRWVAVRHYSDVIISTIASQITSVLTVYSIWSGQAQIKENIKAPCHWPLWGEFTGDQWIPCKKDELHWKCFHLMMSPWLDYVTGYQDNSESQEWMGDMWHVTSRSVKLYQYNAFLLYNTYDISFLQNTSSP